jgi:ElaB/YqjD/DUF883 family membrane-anchored ribosome-binding protein
MAKNTRFMKNHKEAAHTPKEILDELKTLVAEAETMMADSVSEHTSDAIANLRDRFTAAQERFTDMYDNTKKKVVAGAKYTDTAIRENPYQSLAIALGVGVLVGLLVGRRGK